MTHIMSELEILNAALAVGWVKFSYYKADGTKRVAIGTRNAALIETIKGVKLDHAKSNNYYERLNGYFDLTRANWRQFNTDRFIGLELDRLTNEQAATIALTIAYGFDECEVCCSVLDAISKLVSNSFAKSIYNVIDMEFDYHDLNDFDECERVIVAVGKRMPSCKIVKTETPKRSHREDLIAELQQIRKREEEILAELLYQY